MDSKDKKLIIGGLLICFIIAVLSPFIASTAPDGLEKSAEQIMPNATTENVVDSPMPDYTIVSLGKYGEVLALIIGVLLTLGIAYGVSILLKRKKPPEESDE